MHVWDLFVPRFRQVPRQAVARRSVFPRHSSLFRLRIASRVTRDSKAAGFVAGLEAVAAGSPAAGVVTGRVPDGGPAVSAGLGVEAWLEFREGQDSEFNGVGAWGLALHPTSTR